MNPLLWPLQWLLPDPFLQLHCRQWLASMAKTWHLPLQPPCTAQHQACAVLLLSSWMHCAADLDPPRIALVCNEEHGWLITGRADAPHPCRACCCQCSTSTHAVLCMVAG